MDIYEYLISLPGDVLDRLYSDVWTCLAIFRSLPALSKQYVMRMIFLTTPLPRSAIDSWLLPNQSAVTSHQTALKRLLSLRIILERSGNGGMSLNHHFQHQLKIALLNPDQTLPLKSKLGRDKRRPSRGKLSQYAMNCWEAILHYMVGSTSKQPSDGMIKLLEATTLLTKDGEAHQISSTGFQFLLKSTYTQLWIILLSYLETTEERKMNKQEVLSFLFQLSFLQLGKDYPVEGLTPTQHILLIDLKEFGLIYQHKDSSRRFYPTKLAINLCSGGNLHLEDHDDDDDDSDEEREEEGDSKKSKKKRKRKEEPKKKPKLNPNSLNPFAPNTNNSGWIVVETNFKVYAHTTSTLKIWILNIFLTLEYRIADLVAGMITRQSIREALIHGISANQIISFLEQNAHPKMREKKANSSSTHTQSILPPVVAEQIRLWESERNRITFSKGMLYEKFPSFEAFDSTVKYAKSIGAYVWHNQEKQLLFISEAGQDQMKSHCKQKQI